MTTNYKDSDFEIDFDLTMREDTEEVTINCKHCGASETTVCHDTDRGTLADRIWGISRAQRQIVHSTNCALLKAAAQAEAR